MLSPLVAPPENNVTSLNKVQYNLSRVCDRLHGSETASLQTQKVLKKMKIDPPKLFVDTVPK